MIHDARRVPGGSRIETDVCIVGGGAAGISMALALSDSRLRVCLLESGGLEPDVSSQALYRGRVDGRTYFPLDEARTRQFGGSTNCWQGLCRPLDAIDFEARDWVPHSGWPFGLDALVPWYTKAQKICRLGDFEYTGEHWAAENWPLLPFASDRVATWVFQIAPTRFGQVYRDAIRTASNVDTYLFGNAVELVVGRDGGRVERVRVACLDGRGFELRARVFVLATGGIENARLLLASNAVQSSGLGNEHDLVGRFFMEHPHVISAAVLPSRKRLPLRLYRPRQVGRMWVSAYLTAPESVLRRERMLGFSSFLERSVELPEFDGALARVVQEMDARRADSADKAILLMTAGEQVPNPESRVRLADERDALGMPRVQLEWRLSALDKRSARRANELLAQEWGRAGLGRLRLLLSDDDSWPAELSGGRHHMGTTRMHDEPRYGVVDANCRMHGLANLFVAGSSVFPTSGAANPTLTIIALALRLADHLRGLSW